MQRAHRSVAGLDVAQLKQRHRAPLRPLAARTSGRGLVRVVVLGAEVGLDHGGVRAHLGRRPVGDLTAEVQDVDVLGDAHHEVHVVLDEQHRQLVVVADLADEAPELLDLLVVQAAGGLVQQKQLRTATTSARASSTRFSVPNGSPATGRCAMRREPDVVDRLARLRLAAAAARVRADEHVVEHRHRLEELDVLERAGDAAAHDPDAPAS